MSRTYRKKIVFECPTCGYGKECHSWGRNGGYHNKHLLVKPDCRDGKPSYKPTSDWKRDRRRLRRARVKEILREAKYDPSKYDNIPNFRRSDVWDWN